MAEIEKPIEVMAMEALGKGFDITGDFRLKYAKGTRLVVLDETNKRDIVFPGAGFTVKAVSQDIRLDKGDRIRFKSDVLEFNQKGVSGLVRSSELKRCREKMYLRQRKHNSRA